MKRSLLGVATTFIGVITDPIFEKLASTLQKNAFYKENTHPFFNKSTNFNFFKPVVSIVINVTITRMVLSILTTSRRHLLKDLVNILKGTVATFALSYCLQRFTAQPRNPTTIYLTI